MEIALCECNIILTLHLEKQGVAEAAQPPALAVGLTQAPAGVAATQFVVLGSVTQI